MKLGRNDPCSCGSGKKYKKCCMDTISKQHADVFDDVEQIVAMNPNLTIDELNVVAQHRMKERNNRPNSDFCGLSPTQMANWLYAPLSELADVTIDTPNDLSSSPVMRYLGLILEEGLAQDGAFKCTSKGNLPAKLAKSASDLLPEFAVSEFSTPISISDYAGSNEDKFIALHYTRVLAEMSGIIYRRSGRYHIKKSAQKQYQSEGIQAFFLPMLESAITKYNWAYLDSWDDSVDLRTFWLFMLWRLQSHGSVSQLVNEVKIAFPDLLSQLDIDDYFTPDRLLDNLIETRFIERFLQFWGFVTLNPIRMLDKKEIPRIVEIEPLLKKTFLFSV